MAGPWEKYSNSAPQDGPWNKYSDAPKEETPPSFSDGAQAAIEHFGNAASLGYAPQLQAVVSKLMPDPNAELDEKMKAQGFKIDQKQPTYTQDRDSNIRRMQQQESDYPIASGVGSVAGSIASGIAASGLTPINAAGRMGRVAQAAKGGAVIGALSNPGDVEGRISGLQIDERGKNALGGAAIGAAGQGVIEGVSATAKAASNIASKLTGKAEERAFKSSGAMLKDYRKAAGKDRVNTIGRAMLDEGLVQPGSTFGDVVEKSSQLKDSVGKVIKDTYKDASDIVKNPDFIKGLSSEQQIQLAESAFKPSEFADAFESSLKKQFKGTPGFNKSLPQVQSVLSDIRELGDDVGMLELQKAKVDVDSLINYDKDIRDQPLAKQLLSKLRGALSEKIDQRMSALDSVLGTDSLKTLKEANKQYGIWAEVNNISSDRVLRENAKNFFSLNEGTIGGLGAVAGFASGDGIQDRIKKAAMGGAIGLAGKGLRTYGTPLASQALDKAGRFLSKPAFQAVGRGVLPAVNALEKSPASIATAVKAMSSPDFEKSVGTSVMRSVAEEKQLKGEDKWASDGLKKLGLSDESLLQSKKVRQLLIEASDLPEGSKRLEKIKSIIQGREK